jgi:nicotinic acid mononucleotide adenylyltransferase
VTSSQNSDAARPERADQYGGPRVGVYPGSFNPPTVAHLAIAEAARERHNLDRIDLCVSTAALAKEHVVHPLFDHRLEVLEAAVADLHWLTIRATELQLLADIADGYEVLIMGADKWVQIQDPVWYGDDPAARDRALASLPTVAVAPRDGLHTPPDLTLDVIPDLIAKVSSTIARAGETRLMLSAAQDFAQRTGAWIEPERYAAWIESSG